MRVNNNFPKISFLIRLFFVCQRRYFSLLRIRYWLCFVNLPWFITYVLKYLISFLSNPMPHPPPPSPGHLCVLANHPLKCPFFTGGWDKKGFLKIYGDFNLSFLKSCGRPSLDSYMIQSIKKTLIFQCNMCCNFMIISYLQVNWEFTRLINHKIYKALNLNFIRIIL